MSPLVEELRNAAARRDYWPAMETIKRWADAVDAIKADRDEWSAQADRAGRDLSAALQRASEAEALLSAVRDCVRTCRVRFEGQTTHERIAELLEGAR